MAQLGMFKMLDIDSLDNRDEAKIAKAARFAELTYTRYHRAKVIGVDRVPSGGALYVGNHNSFSYSPDTFIFGAAVFRKHGISAVPYGLAHEVALKFPPINWGLVPLGAVRASHDNGTRLLRAGHKVLVYPGGDYDALRPYRHRNRIVFGNRRGYIRLALNSGVPIVPVVAAGAHSTFWVVDDMRWLARLLRTNKLFRTKVWPLTFSLPWGLTLGPPPPHLPMPSRIRIEILEPIVFDRSGAEAAADDDYVGECAGVVQTAMQTTLTRLAAELR